MFRDFFLFLRFLVLLCFFGVFRFPHFDECVRNEELLVFFWGLSGFG